MSNSLDIDRLRWYGLKPLLRNIATFAPVNALLRAIGWLLPAKRRIRIPVSLPAVDYNASGAVVLLTSPNICHVAQSVYWGRGRRDQANDDQVMRFLERRAPALDLFLDIGAYTGLFALVVAKLSAARVVAFEILPINHEVLVANINRNDVTVDARLQGLGARPDAITMPYDPDLSVLPSSFNLATHFDEGIDIPVTTLDTEFADFSGSALLKLDVEGFEGEVLRGGSEFLHHNRPDMICEVLLRDRLAEPLMALLAPLGYRYFLSTAQGLVEHDAIVPDRANRDWLFTTRDPVT